ncbi:MAG: ETC complex I subunit [Rhodobacteraceae bacterium]|nr:ETC complex I subunit [Paracoccaceae bacterium]
MSARIYQPSRNAMQSGQGKSGQWVLEFEPAVARGIDPLMGWTSSNDMNSQVRVQFDSKEAAVEFATEKGLAYQVSEPKLRKPLLRQGGYAENFASNRKSVWTH